MTPRALAWADRLAILALVDCPTLTREEWAELAELVRGMVPPPHRLCVADESAPGRNDGWEARCECGWRSAASSERHADFAAMLHRFRPETPPNVDASDYERPARNPNPQTRK